jgi:hypothetical protein
MRRREFIAGLGSAASVPNMAVNMNQRLETAVQLIALAAFIAAILIIVTTTLTLISAQCTRGTPFLPTIFPCFAGQ